jgi:Zn-dependent peptidase ImmA (M78 family)
MKEESEASAVHSDLATRIAACSGGGESLPQPVLREMETRFGADFTDVRIHTGGEAIDLCQQLGAQAFTHGKDIFFNAGKFDPESNAGKFLLAHELTHIIQQSDETELSGGEA